MAHEPILGLQISHCRFRERVLTLYGRTRVAHQGSKFTLYYIRQGFCHLHTRDQVLTLRKGDVYISGPYASYRLQAGPGQSPSLYVMTFLPMARKDPPATLKAYGLPLFSRIRRPGEMTHLFASLAALFADRTNPRNRFWAEDCSLLGMQILRLLEPAPQPPAARTSDCFAADRRIWDVLDYINRHYKDRLTVATLAGQAGLCPVYFSRSFKRATGLPPHRYVLEKKIQKAKDLMSVFAVSPVAAGDELGFQDYSHFSRIFRKIAGLSPKQYARGSRVQRGR